MGEMKPDLAPLQQLRGYWEGLRIGSRLPERAQIDPRGISGALENAFLIERIAPGLAKFRLCGMQLHDVMGMEPAGMPLSVLMNPESRARLSPALEQVFAGPGTLEVWLEAERGIGKPALSGRMLILPLLDQAGDVRLALGGLVTAGAIGRQPRRFAISTVMAETLPRAAAPHKLPLPEFAEAPARFVPAPRPQVGKPNLRLVSSRD
jgi:hypothetical protein